MNYLFKYCLIVFFFYAISHNALTQVDRAQIAAAYIINFTRYTLWPNEDQIDSFKIVIFSDNIDIINELENFSQKRRIIDKPVIVSKYKSFPDLNKSQIILLSHNKAGYLLDIYNAIEGKPVLLVSEDYNDKRNIMINLYETEDKQMLFEINKANVINQGLIIDPEILLAGGTEIDVASLYRNSKVSLRNMQKEMDKINDSLEFLNGNIRISINQINKEQAELSKQKLLLAESNEKLKSYQQEILFQKAILESQKDSIKYKNRILQEQLLEASEMEQFLKSRQKQIEILNREIKNKNKVLGDQSEIIVRQKLMLVLFIIIGVLSVFLVTTVFISYRNNKKKKDILTRKNEIIKERLDELKQLNIKLEKADQYKSIFLASMSHELRTPLNSIIGYTGILLMGMTGKLNDEQNKQLNKVKNNAKHLLSLINDILDISKIEADKVELQYEEFNLKNLINEVVEIIHPKIAEKGLELTTEVPDNFIIYTDSRRIKQVVLNLVSNAVNYTDSGNICIYARKLSKNKFTISVKDTGIGISESELERLFQPFQQIDSSLTKKNQGTGLGLYLCKKLMNLLGGDIFVNSEYGKGCEFYIEMPVKSNKISEHL